jgi:hypothetical protein
MNQVLVAGTVLVVLGVINVTFPDPLPLADEILMIGGGAGVGIAGYATRSKNLPLLRDKSERAAQRLKETECRVDPLLTRIHEAIRARSVPAHDHAPDESADLFELESRWLVEYLDLHRLLDSNAVTLGQIESLLDVLSNAFALSRFLDVEQKLRQDPKNRRARTARDKMAEGHGLSADAFTVYAEFYRLARQIVNERSEGNEGRGRG